MTAHPAVRFTHRIRATVATVALSLFGLRPTPRRARWLVHRLAGDAHVDDSASLKAMVERARARLTAAADGVIDRHRAAAEPRQAATLQSRLPRLAQAAQEACETVLRLESRVPPGAIEEPLSRGLQLLVAAGLLTEGWITFVTLQGSALGSESPVVLLLSALVAAPLAAALLRFSGVLVRRTAWIGRVTATDIAAIVVSLTLPVSLGIGLTLARVEGVTTGRDSALMVSGGLQAVILGMAFFEGFSHATPVAGLAWARRQRLLAVRPRDALATALRRLEKLHQEREVELRTVAAEALSEFDHEAQRLFGEPSHLGIRWPTAEATVPARIR